MSKVTHTKIPLLSPEQAQEKYKDNLLIVEVSHIENFVTERSIRFFCDKKYIKYKTVAVELGKICSTVYMIDKKTLKQKYYEERNK